VAEVIDCGMTAAVPAKLPRSVELEHLVSPHSHTYTQSPTALAAGPSVRKSEKVMETLEAFVGAIVQEQNHESPYSPLVMFPRYEFKVIPESGHILF
jgi:hypothetical protein